MQLPSRSGASAEDGVNWLRAPGVSSRLLLRSEGGGDGRGCKGKGKEKGKEKGKKKSVGGKEEKQQVAVVRRGKGR